MSTAFVAVSYIFYRESSYEDKCEQHELNGLP